MARCTELVKYYSQSIIPAASFCLLYFNCIYVVVISIVVRSNRKSKVSANFAYKMLIPITPKTLVSFFVTEEIKLSSEFLGAADISSSTRSRRDLFQVKNVK